MQTLKVKTKNWIDNEATNKVHFSIAIVATGGWAQLIKVYIAQWLKTTIIFELLSSTKTLCDPTYGIFYGLSESFR